MNLEQFYVFPIDKPLTSDKRRAINERLDAQVAQSERPMSYQWLKRGDEKFLRILVDPVTIEVVFFADRIEFFGAAPTVAKLLFTKAKRKELKAFLERLLVDAGFVEAETVSAQG